MALAYRAGSFVSAGNASGGDLTLTKPTGTADGDIVVIWVQFEPDTCNITVSPGSWETVKSVNTGSFNETIFIKRASSEPASYTISNDVAGDQWRVAVGVAYSGGTGTGTLKDQSSINQGDSALITAQTALTITPTVNNCLVVFAYGNSSANNVTTTTGFCTNFRSSYAGLCFADARDTDKSATGTSRPSDGVGSETFSTVHVAIVEDTGGGTTSSSVSPSASPSASPSQSPSASSSPSSSPSGSPSKSPSASASPSSSPSASPSFSPSASSSPSASPSSSRSQSPSASGSPSQSPSASASPSSSPSASPSGSRSASPSESPSSSASPSFSPSASASPSAGAPISGTVCWGHITGATEDNVRTFAGNWTGTGAITDAGDNEKICLNAGEYMESEIVHTGVKRIELLQNVYLAGDTIRIRHRQSGSDVAILSEPWTTYTTPFESAGYVQVRVESTL